MSTVGKGALSDFANVATGTTDGSVVAAVAGRKIRVYSISVVVGATAQSVTFNTKGSGAGTAITCLFACAANGGFVLPYNPAGWFTTNAGEALTATTTAAGSTSGILVTYELA